MKCTGRKITALFLTLSLVFVSLTGCGKEALIRSYPEVTIENSAFSNSYAYNVNGFADRLCVAGSNIIPQGMEDIQTTAGLFSLDTREVLYANNIHERMHPASITKILTALVFLENYTGDYTELITASENVIITESGAVTCGFKPGDQVPVDVVLNGLLIYSGNDAAIMLAEYVAGSVEGFAELMNQKALSLGATNSHFMNPHGLTQDEHYATAYDLYLLFQRVMQYDKFVEIINRNKYEGQYITANGESKTVSWSSTNMFLTGEKEIPENITVIGGKTGTTKAAGSCLILLSQDADGKKYVAIVMKANDRKSLYDEMQKLLRKTGGE